MVEETGHGHQVSKNRGGAALSVSLCSHLAFASRRHPGIMTPNITLQRLCLLPPPAVVVRHQADSIFTTRLFTKRGFYFCEIISLC